MDRLAEQVDVIVIGCLQLLTVDNGQTSRVGGFYCDWLSAVVDRQQIMDRLAEQVQFIVIGCLLTVDTGQTSRVGGFYCDWLSVDSR